MGYQTSRREEPPFRAGDEVLLAEGAYQGTPGVFLALTEDVNWAEIRERDGTIRHHPIVWLQHAACPTALPNEPSISADDAAGNVHAAEIQR